MGPITPFDMGAFECIHWSHLVRAITGRLCGRSGCDKPLGPPMEESLATPEDYMHTHGMDMRGRADLHRADDRRHE